jgi:hypothetical protein
MSASNCGQSLRSGICGAARRNTLHSHHVALHGSGPKVSSRQRTPLGRGLSAHTGRAGRWSTAAKSRAQFRARGVARASPDEEDSPCDREPRLAFRCPPRGVDDLGTGVDDNRSARQLGGHASKAERKATPSLSVRSSVTISSCGGRGRARPSSSGTESSRVSSRLRPDGLGRHLVYKSSWTP